jgi:hypothetical protein
MQFWNLITGFLSVLHPRWRSGLAAVLPDALKLTILGVEFITGFVVFNARAVASREC